MINYEQLQYYKATASQYDAMHGGHSEHYRALQHITPLLHLLGARSALDIGCGTGRTLNHLKQYHPNIKQFGIDPSPDLLHVAHSINEVPKSCLLQGDGSKLPFRDKTLDVTFALGVLHHVEHPELLIAEMARVSTIGVFISDINMYGRGHWAFRMGKLLARSLGVLHLAQRIRHRGDIWIHSEGDGPSRAYSIFDSESQLHALYADVHFIPLSGGVRQSQIPLLDASHLLAVALSNPPMSRIQPDK